MTIDLLVQKTVVHNLLRIPQSTLPLLQSTVQMESSWSSTQKLTTTSSNILEFFFLNTIWGSLRNYDCFTGAQDCFSQFLRIPQRTFPLLQSTVQMESSWSSTQTLTTTSSNIFEFFVETPFGEASEMTIDLLVHKTVFHNFLRIPQTTFP